MRTPLTLNLWPLGASGFGAEIHGLDLGGGLSDRVMGEILDALYAHRFLVIKNQHLDEARYLAFGRRLGRPVAHPLDHLRMPGWPEIEPIGNVNEKDRDAAVRNGAAFWHTDQSYEAEPASMIVLYALEMPEVGGETLIADLRSAYEDLDHGTRSRIDSLVVRHAYEAAQGGDGEERAIPIRTEEQRARLPAVRHYLAPRIRSPARGPSTRWPASPAGSRAWKTGRRAPCSRSSRRTRSALATCADTGTRSGTFW